MKKIFLLLILITCCTLCVSAGAAPAVTDGTVSAWMAENGFLDWQAEDGTVLQVPIAMEDILEIQNGEVLCLTRDQRVLSVQKDGYRTLANADPVSLSDQRISIEDGKLAYEGTEVSATACAAVTDGRYIYYVEKNGNAWILSVRSVQESENPVLPGSRDAYALALSGKPVTEPLSLTVTRDALTMTDTEHRVLAMNLLTGVATEYPPTAGEKTAAACMAGDILYRYTLQEDGKWAYESSVSLSQPAPVTTPVPTPAPTPAPTPTPKPTPAPTSLIDDDGTVYFGAYGKTVRKIQQRLADLGYPTGKVDGKYGDQTQLAINLFCNAIHVREHNYIPPKVQKKLFAADAPVYDPYLPLKKGDRGVSVLYMQVRLKELGYDPKKLDGIYGKMTVEAVAQFQKDYGIVLAENEKPGEVASHEMMVILFAPEPTPTVSPTPAVTAEPSAAPTAEPTANPTPTPNYATQTDLK